MKGEQILGAAKCLLTSVITVVDSTAIGLHVGGGQLDTCQGRQNVNSLLDRYETWKGLHYSVDHSGDDRFVYLAVF